MGTVMTYTVHDLVRDSGRWSAPIDSSVSLVTARDLARASCAAHEVGSHVAVRDQDGAELVEVYRRVLRGGLRVVELAHYWIPRVGAVAQCQCRAVVLLGRVVETRSVCVGDLLIPRLASPLGGHWCYTSRQP